MILVNYKTLTAYFKAGLFAIVLRKVFKVVAILVTFISETLSMLASICTVFIRGGQKNTKVEFQLACKVIPFSLTSHLQKHKAHLWEPPSSGCHFSRKIYKGNYGKYKGKIWKQDISKTIL